MAALAASPIDDADPLLSLDERFERHQSVRDRHGQLDGIGQRNEVPDPQLVERSCPGLGDAAHEELACMDRIGAGTVEPGVFRRATEGIEALVSARKQLGAPGPILSINCVISRHNIASLEEMADLAMDLGADILQLQHTIFDTKDNVDRHNRFLSFDRAHSHGLDLMAPSISEGGYYQNEFLPEDLPRLKAGLKGVMRRSKGRIKLLFFPSLPLEMVAPYYLDLDHPFSQSCDYLWKTCRILPDGTVSPCLHVLIGNIRDKPLLALWNSPRMRRFRTLITERLFPGCARCCHRNYKD